MVFNKSRRASKYKKRGTRRPYSRPYRGKRLMHMQHKQTGHIYSPYRAIAMPFKPNFYTKMTYVKSGSLTQSLQGVIEVQTFRANSLFDPDQTGTGIQPRYLDTLLGPDGTNAPYHKYRVFGCKVNAKILPRSATTSIANCQVSLIPRQPNVGSPVTLEEARERTYSKSILMTSSNASGVRTINQYLRPKIHFGIKDMKDNSNTEAAYNANPAQQLYVDLCLIALDTTSVAVIDYVVTLTYYVQLFELNDVADS